MPHTDTSSHFLFIRPLTDLFGNLFRMSTKLFDQRCVERILVNDLLVRTNANGFDLMNQNPSSTTGNITHVVGSRALMDHLEHPLIDIVELINPILPVGKPFKPEFFTPLGSDGFDASLELRLRFPVAELTVSNTNLASYFRLG